MKTHNINILEEDGFSLVEILVSLAITAIIFMAVNSFFNDHSTTMNESSRKKHSLDLANELLDRISSDYAKERKMDLAPKGGVNIEVASKKVYYENKCVSAPTAATKKNKVVFCGKTCGSSVPSIITNSSGKNISYPSSPAKDAKTLGAASAAICSKKVGDMITVSVLVYYEAKNQKISHVVQKKSFPVGDNNTGVYFH